MLDHMEIGVREIAGARAFYCLPPTDTMSEPFATPQK